MKSFCQSFGDLFFKNNQFRIMRGRYKPYKRIQQFFMDIHFSHQIGRSLPNSLESIHLFYLLSRGGGHSYAHTRNFSSLWVTKELESSLNLIIHESSRKHSSKSHVNAQIEGLQKHCFWYTDPYCSLCNSEHTCQDMLMLPQKLFAFRNQFAQYVKFIVRPDVRYTGLWHRKWTAKLL